MPNPNSLEATVQLLWPTETSFGSKVQKWVLPFLVENLEKSFECAEIWFGAAVRWDGLPAKFSDRSRKTFVNYRDFSAALLGAVLRWLIRGCIKLAFGLLCCLGYDHDCLMTWKRVGGSCDNVWMQ